MNDFPELPVEPPLHQLEKWATPRLLRFYKAKRDCRNHHAKLWGESDLSYLFYVEYVDEIKKILDKREHVKS